MIGNFPDHEFDGSMADADHPNPPCLATFTFAHDDGSSVTSQCGHTRDEHPGDGIPHIDASKVRTGVFDGA